MTKKKDSRGSSPVVVNIITSSNTVSESDNFAIIKLLLENHFQSNDELYQAQKEQQDRHGGEQLVSIVSFQMVLLT